jgi:hypothetical protein
MCLPCSLPIAMPDDAFGAALIEQAAALSAYARRRLRRRRCRRPSAGHHAPVLDRASFAAGTSLAAWARTVMKNSFLTGRRRARFHADLPEEARDRMLRVGRDPSLAVWLRDTDWALSELPPHQREAVLLASQGVSIEDGAAQLGIAQAHSRAASHAGGLGCAPSSRSDRRRCWPTGPIAICTHQRPSGPSTCGKTGLAGRQDRLIPVCLSAYCFS